MLQDRASVGLAIWSFERLQFSRALESVWTLISAVDAYLTTTKPWALAEDKSKRDELAYILYTAAQALHFIAVLLHPVLPDSTKKIWSQLGHKNPLDAWQIDNLCWGQLTSGTPIGKLQHLFHQIQKPEAITRF